MAALVNLTTVVNGCSYTLISKFKNDDRNYINVTSTDSRGDTRELTFADSLSECGFWRICIMNGVSPNMIKGFDYTMCSFIILELQFFINANIQDVEDITDYKNYNMEPLPLNWRKITPVDGSSPFYYNNDTKLSQYNHPSNTINIENETTGCVKQYSTIDMTLNNSNRQSIFNIDEITNYNHESIRPVNEYTYRKELTNYHPVNYYNQENFNRLSMFQKRQTWPEDPTISFSTSPVIQYGNTIIELNGIIYSIIADTSIPDIKIKIYYMIYNCDIILPEDIHPYEQPEGNVFHFPTRITERNLIIPIYFLPEYTTPKTLDYDISGYGLYNEFISLHETYYIKVCKFLEYIFQMNSIPPPKPTCTTIYGFQGYYYNSMKFLNHIKLLTRPELKSAMEGAVESSSEFEPFPPSLGGSRKRKKTKRKKTKRKTTKNRDLKKN
jgi:hypothetical protein